MTDDAEFDEALERARLARDAYQEGLRCHVDGARMKVVKDELYEAEAQSTRLKRAGT
ncbi:MAG TPA: hypothetical protein VK283_14320 [Acidimicrobiales bacterium]|nr:hypothetical protein [Acidimicrobiales bacterium]